MLIYNTLTQKKEAFETHEPGKAKLYVCGPTTYDYAHIGHARCYVVYDILVRHLRQSGYEVRFVRNVTDVDDKIIQRAKDAGEEPVELSKRFFEAYTEDMASLGNIEPDVEPKVSDHIAEIITLIEDLIRKEAAYEAAGDVYFHVPNFAAYGQLSHRNLDDLLAGASGRTDEAEAGRKRHPFDFALWKKSTPGESGWPSPFGEGRPGWHIECSAMSMKHLGESFDLHGGGLDLVFPHHENEIAQSEAATGKPMARTWMHNGFVQVNKEKMGKSLGNFFTIREVFKYAEPEALRYALLTMHYRAPFNLDWDTKEDGHVAGFPQFEEAEKRLEYIYNTRLRLEAIPQKRKVDASEPVPDSIAGFASGTKKVLDDDLNTPQALAQASELLAGVNHLCDRAFAKKGKIPEAWVSAAKQALRFMSDTLGIGADEPRAFLERVRNRRAVAMGLDRAQIDQKIGERDAARANKDYARSDQVRDELAQMGVELLDSPEGTTWRLSAQ